MRTGVSFESDEAVSKAREERDIPYSFTMKEAIGILTIKLTV